jgi:hypothetical protein
MSPVPGEKGNPGPGRAATGGDSRKRVAGNSFCPLAPRVFTRWRRGPTGAPDGTGEGELKDSKKKMLAGAPRSGRWTKETPEKKRIGGPHHASIKLLIVVAAVIVVGIGAYTFFAWRQLDAGLMAQYGQQRARRDWVRLK